MVGEVGEVAEALQWRSGIRKADFAEEERHHLGEELSDVWIYATRLCDVCGVDLARCCDSFIRGEPLVDVRPMSGTTTWGDLQFSTISNALQLEEQNPRFFCLKLAAQSGVVAERFAAKLECPGGLKDWSSKELADFGFSIASVCVLLASLAKLLDLDLGGAIASKMDKNERKYPVDKARGSSAKYTKYMADTRWQTTLLVGTGLILGIFLGRQLK